MPESYQGIKFKTLFRDKQPPSDPRICELIRWCVTFHELGLAPPYPGGSYGNLSFRIKAGEPAFIITATATALKHCSGPGDFVSVWDCNVKKKRILASGSKEPSSESMLHYAVYNEMPHIYAIFHGHCPEMIEQAQTLGIPTTEKQEPYGSPALAAAVLKLAKQHDFIVAREHGFFAFAESIEKAGKKTLQWFKKTGCGF